MKKFYSILLAALLLPIAAMAQATAEVYVDDPDAVSLFVSDMEMYNYREIILTNSGDVPNKVSFNPETESTFVFIPIPATASIYQMSINGTVVINSMHLINFVKNGDVIRILVHEPVVEATVTFKGKIDAIDHITLNGEAVTLTDNAFDALTGDIVEVYPAEGWKSVSVLANGKKVSFDSALGCYAFTISAASTTVMIDGIYDSIDAISTDSDDAPAYNLQGVKMHGPLAPGIYIRAGRKVMVK